MSNWAIKLISVLATLAVLPLSGIAASEVETTETELMLESPHRYWAKRLVFKDKVIGLPTGKSSKITGNRYYEFSTDILGSVYATEDVRDEILELPLDRDYIFGGTILSKGRLIGGAQFYYVVERVVEHLTEPETIQEKTDDLISAETSQSTEPVIRVIGEVLYTGQAALLTHAMNNDFEFDEYFAEDSAYAAKIEDIFRSVVSGLNKSGEMSPDDVLVKLLTSSLHAYYSAEEQVENNETFMPVEGTDAVDTDLDQVFTDEEKKAMASEEDSMDDLEMDDETLNSNEESSDRAEDTEVETDVASQEMAASEEVEAKETMTEEAIMADETEEVIMVDEVEEITTAEEKMAEAPAEPKAEMPKEETLITDTSLKAETQKWLEELLSEDAEDLDVPEPLEVEQ